MERDREVATNHVRKQRELLDSATLAAQAAFQKRVESGRTLFVAYKTGIVTPESVSTYNTKALSAMMLDLIALVEWTKITQAMFCEWEGDLSFVTKKLSDAMYLRAADRVKEEKENVESEVFTDLLCLVAVHKSGTGGDVEKVFEVCSKIIGVELLNAKYIKSTKRE